MREPPRGGNTVRGDHKEAMQVTTRFKDEILPHSGDEKQERNRGRGVPGKGREREVLGTKGEYIPVLQVLT